jgi:tetratricopeptide (TPR) repeat protein
MPRSEEGGEGNAALGPAQELPPTAPPAVEPAGVTSTQATDEGAAEVAIEAGLAAYKHRRFSQAEMHFQRAVEADPHSAAAEYYLGYTIYKRVERRRNDPAKARALEHFDKAFTLDPAFRPTWGVKSAAKPATVPAAKPAAEAEPAATSGN